MGRNCNEQAGQEGLKNVKKFGRASLRILVLKGLPLSGYSEYQLAQLPCKLTRIVDAHPEVPIAHVRGVILFVDFEIFDRRTFVEYGLPVVIAPELIMQFLGPFDTCEPEYIHCQAVD